MNFVSVALLFISTVFLELGSVLSTCTPSPVGYIVQTGYATTPTTGCGQAYPIVQTLYPASSAVPSYSATSSSQAQASSSAQSGQTGYYGSSGLPTYSGSSSQAQASSVAQSANSGPLAQALSQAQSSGSGVQVLAPTEVHQTSSNSAGWQTGAVTTWQRTFHGVQSVPTTTTTCVTACV